jgi:hypothetical protein
MKITLSPLASNKTTQVNVNGTTLTIDGTNYDLSSIPVGGQAEAVEGSPFIGLMTQEAVTIRYEYDTSKAVPNQSKDLNDYIFNQTAGEILSPITWRV